MKTEVDRLGDFGQMAEAMLVEQLAQRGMTKEELQAEVNREAARYRQAKRIKARRRKLGQSGFVASGRSAIPGKRPFRRTRNSR